MEIRHLPADPNVVGLVAGWLFREWGHLSPGASYQRSVERLIQRTGSAEVPVTLVAFEGDQAIGTASLVADDMETRPQFTPWLASVYVLPESRTQGVGSELCKAIITELNRLNIKRAYLFTPNKEEFYQRLGWRTIEREIYRGEQVTVMTYELAG